MPEETSYLVFSTNSLFTCKQIKEIFEKISLEFEEEFEEFPWLADCISPLGGSDPAICRYDLIVAEDAFVDAMERHNLANPYRVNKETGVIDLERYESYRLETLLLCGNATVRHFSLFN